MDRFGDLSGVIFNVRTGRLIGAHQRRQHIPDDAEIVLVAPRRRKPNAQGTIANGWLTIDGERWAYREVDVDEHREKAMNIAANRWGEGGWDFEALPDLLREIRESVPLELLGWDPSALNVFKLDLTDAPTNGAQLGAVQYQLIVSCAGEREQAKLCEELEARGLTCRLLTL